MAENNRILTAAAVAAAGLMIAGGAAAANASTTPTPQATSSSSAQAGAQQGHGSGAQGQNGPDGPRQMHQHTAVTGDELATVKAAVQAKDASVTVSDVQKDPDGSYDVHGTKAGSPVMVEVSKDLKTVEVRTGGPGGPGGRGHHGGMHQHTAVTGTEATSVKDAVKAKDATITVTEVRKDPDGSYDVMGTKAGSPVMVEVSKDLKTVEVRTGGPGGHGGPGAMPGQSGQQGQPDQQAPADRPTASASSAA